MADISLPPPAPLSGIAWRASDTLDLLDTVLRNLSPCTGADTSAAWKKALWQRCLGAEGQRVLGTRRGNVTDIDYDAVVELLRTHFAVPQSALLRRFLFLQRHRLTSESMKQYVANLRI